MSTDNLPERLRRHGGHNIAPELLSQAADALDAKDAEIERLKDELERTRQAWVVTWVPRS